MQGLFFLRSNNMVMKSLILGVLFSVGIFGIKSGVGLSYCIAGSARTRRKVCAFSLFTLTYLLVFSGAILLLQYVDFVGYLDIVQQLLRSGMLVHMIIAALMLGWGILLLKNSDGTSRISRGWLILAMPCPVCLTVILFSTAVLVSYFPEHMVQTTALFFLAFIGISLLTSAAVSLLLKKTTFAPDGFLGGAMLLMAAYFILSAAIMPQVADIEKIYRMACYHNDMGAMDVTSVINMVLATAAIFFTSYSWTMKKIRSLQ
jgi:predicted transporter